MCWDKHVKIKERNVILCGTTVVIVGGGINNTQIVTEVGKYALDAVQNNPSVDGTLAYKLNKLYSGIYYKQGDKISEQRVWTGGTLTSSSKYLCFTVPIHFITDATPKLNLIAVQARYNGEYLVGTTDPMQTDFQGINITYTYYEYVGFEVILKKDSAFLLNVNNVSVGINCLFSVDFV